MKLTLRKKIFAALVLLMVLFILVSSEFMLQVLGSIATQEVERSLRHSQKAYQHFKEQRFELLLIKARSIAQTPHLRATLSIPQVDHETVFFGGLNLLDIADTELMLIVDHNGKLSADIRNRDFFNDDLLNYPGVDLGIEGEEYSGIWSYHGNYYQVSIVPIIVGENILGLIVLGNRIDNQDTVKFVSDITGNNVLMAFGDRIFSNDSQLPQHSLSSELDFLFSNPAVSELVPTQSREASMGGKRSLTVVQPTGDDKVNIVLYRALDEGDASISALKMFLLSGMVATAVVGLLLSFWLSAQITRPIQRLIRAAEQYGAGHLHEQITIESNDEIGELAAAFNTMASDISDTQR